MSNDAWKDWSRATLSFWNDEGVGTGFLVSWPDGPNAERLYLVTNKHCLHKMAEGRALRATVTVLMRSSERSAHVVSKDLLLKDGTKHSWREHPIESVDVGAIHVTALAEQGHEVQWTAIRSASFGTAEVRTCVGVSVGDSLLLPGYPDGLMQAPECLPIGRRGTLATAVGSQVASMRRDQSGGFCFAQRPAFLVDGFMIHGQSGSPVIWDPAGRTGPPLLLGILAETEMTRVRTGEGETAKQVDALAGFGVAHSVERIIQVLNLFTFSEGGELLDQESQVT